MFPGSKSEQHQVVKITTRQKYNELQWILYPCCSRRKYQYWNNFFNLRFSKSEPYSMSKTCEHWHKVSINNKIYHQKFSIFNTYWYTLKVYINWLIWNSYNEKRHKNPLAKTAGKLPYLQSLDKKVLPHL